MAFQEFPKLLYKRGEEQPLSVPHAEAEAIALEDGWVELKNGATLDDGEGQVADGSEPNAGDEPQAKSAKKSKKTQASA
jgi:hypothetical protein